MVTIVRLLELRWRHMADRIEQTTIVKLIDPLQRLELYVLQATRSF